LKISPRQWITSVAPFSNAETKGAFPLQEKECPV
jgi:hypothetical protein